MNLIDEIVEKYKTDGIRGVLYGAILRIYFIFRNFFCQIFFCRIFFCRSRRFDGKDLDIVQGKIQKAIKKRRDLYLLDENDARALADNWNGVISKPQDLRFIDGAIPIVLSAGEKLAPLMAVALQSLVNSSNSERKYHFIILNEDFSDKTKDFLTNQVSHFSHCFIDFVNIAHVFNEIPISPPTSNYNIYVYSSLLVPYLFDKYEKVIFLDADTMAKTDISELYDLDISGFCLGAAVNQGSEYFLKQKNYSWFLKEGGPIFMLFDNWWRYICVGVLVFDTQKMKTKFSQQDFFRLAIYYTNRYALSFADLDILTILIKEDYYVLPPEWNYYPLISTLSKLPPPFKPKISHFAGRKPWELDAWSDTDPDVLEWRKLAETVPLSKSSTFNKM